MHTDFAEGRLLRFFISAIAVKERLVVVAEYIYSVDDVVNKGKGIIFICRVVPFDQSGVFGVNDRI